MHKTLVFPVETLLGNPTFFEVISTQLDGLLSPQEVMDCFYEAYSASVDPENTGEVDPENFPTMVCFRVSIDPEGEITVDINMNNGIGLLLRGKMQNNSEVSLVSNEKELQRVGHIYRSIVDRLEKEMPQFKGDISLDEVPTPKNHFLQDSLDRSKISGNFNLLSDPTKKFNFTITYDPKTQKTETVIIDL
jgi:hypothetical protein